ncbi:tyrosine-type recombinase/integrase [Clostridium oryzae]|uniref:Tyrosine recombinase XerC n=1 Tax=Clostridium oryzae TaxID=1450648 RepID=A0A1V4IL66_9CLOT|nr:tyrosine-type recombinase/integrase [Clostridium oryzae]OPJ60574.1 tyrosine recombinase XerC [Clostridium oryzae]
MNENRILLQLNSYIDYKHSLGFKLQQEESVLRNFVKFTLIKNYDGPITKEIVFSWISSGNQSDKTMGRKLEVIRPFSRYVTVFDNEAELICGQVYKNVRDRPVPYIYSEDEIVQLMDNCNKLYSPDGIRAKTTAVVIGLLWSTGLRPSEPINLTIDDIDLNNNVLHVRETKFSKERYVPFDYSVAKKLSEYKSWIEQKLGVLRLDRPFFYTTNGKPLTKRSLAYAFKLIRDCLDANPIGYPYVRLYDFRHTMACNTIRHWMEQGIDINANLYILSTYMGHVKPEDTYWYLSATLETLELSCTKYEEMFGGNSYEI